LKGKNMEKIKMLFERAAAWPASSVAQILLAMAGPKQTYQARTLEA
jgi:hypothetical protein